MIQKNKIKSLPPSHDFPSSLHTLNLAFNLLTQVPTTLIHNPPKALTHLHLSGNRFQQLPRDFLSTGYEQLISLDFHTCQLTYLSSDFFEHLSRCQDLRRLNLAINRLTDLPDAIGLLNQLQWLNLNDNQLTHLPASLSQLTGLVKLGLVQNQLRKLPPFVFKHMLQLQKLDMRRNRLRYLPSSMLALAPHQEVDMHANLSVPCQVFPTSCQQDDHPYGGSLRTLLFYENPTVEHVDGILCHLDDEEEQEDEGDCVQVISMAKIHSVLQQQGHTKDQKQILRQALMPSQVQYHYSNHPKFRRPDHPVPNLLSEIDEDDNAVSNNNENDSITAEEKAAIQQETQYLLTQIPSLRELCLRTLLTTAAAIGTTTPCNSDRQEQLICTTLPNTVVPTMLHLDAMTHARQCDFCLGWYTQSRLQVGYLARLCNHRLQVPLRFDVCSVDCAVDAVDKLYQAKVDWQAKQSLAQMDISLLPATAGASTNGGWQHHQNTTLEEEGETSRAESTATTHINNNNDNEEAHQQQQSSPASSYQTVPSASTSPASSSSSSDENCKYMDAKLVSILKNYFFFFFFFFFFLANQCSFTRTIRNRVTQLAPSLFINRNNSTDSGTNLTQQNNPAQQERLLPLVFPNLSLGVPAPVIPLNSNTREEPPAIISMATRLVEGRLQTQRTQPQLRLSTPLPNPTAFNHLPRDAIRLEKF
jgi:Leucine-rich repeat (LRR) protein